MVWQGTANAITHNSSDDKDSITVVWTPPSAMSGEVVFQVTFCTIWFTLLQFLAVFDQF